jgi:hypothetical protein
MGRKNLRRGPSGILVADRKAHPFARRGGTMTPEPRFMGFSGTGKD